MGAGAHLGSGFPSGALAARPHPPGTEGGRPGQVRRCHLPRGAVRHAPPRRPIRDDHLLQGRELADGGGLQVLLAQAAARKRFRPSQELLLGVHVGDHQDVQHDVGTGDGAVPDTRLHHVRERGGEKSRLELPEVPRGDVPLCRLVHGGRAAVDGRAYAGRLQPRRGRAPAEQRPGQHGTGPRLRGLRPHRHVRGAPSLRPRPPQPRPPLGHRRRQGLSPGHPGRPPGQWVCRRGGMACARLPAADRPLGEPRRSHRPSGGGRERISSDG
mmetsp:Transcript_85581/g.242715  ORF Transcript_85581/g.242715 Transcript_85581/m.242715 type:complete len:270 (-) Transcript_85581:6-815(-)